jgi:RimJ/RimL family protein N-acetyltransferase
MTCSSPQKSTIVRAYPTVRRLVRAEAATVIDAVYAGLSAHSRFLRFHSPVPRLPDAVRARLADVDGRRHAAVVAEIRHATGDTEPVGIAHLLGDGDGAHTADVAVAVVDEWQRRSVGRQLLIAVTALAEELGYAELQGIVLPENVAMQRLARSALPWARPWFDGETIRFAAPIGPAAWTLTHEDLLADLVRR